MCCAPVQSCLHKTAWHLQLVAWGILCVVDGKVQTGDIKMQMQIEWTENEVVETREFASLYCFSSCSVNANG